VSARLVWQPWGVTLTKQERASEWGGHLHWEVKQLCQLGVRLEEMRRGGKAELRDAVDVAVLEAFLLHARALIEFVWLSQDPDVRAMRAKATYFGKKIVTKAPYAHDVLAEHFFDRPEQWRPGELTHLIARTHEKSHWGIARCSYTRLDPEEARRWEHAQITRDLARPLTGFALMASSSHLQRRNAIDIGRELEWALVRLPISPEGPSQIVGRRPPIRTSRGSVPR
jgi:hypothetical protein